MHDRFVEASSYIIPAMREEGEREGEREGRRACE